jgi:anti-sigma-K factor RskA
MAKTIEEAMSELRRDVARWQAELSQFKDQGQRDVVEKMKVWIEEAERILARWDDPEVR